jgi:hypothetical protein
LISIATIVAGITAVATNIPAFVALGVDVADVIDKGKALVSSDTASTPEERAAALAEIEGLQGQLAAGLAVLEQQAPNS